MNFKKITKYPTLTITLLAITILCLAPSCSNDNSLFENIPEPNTIVATIDGQHFENHTGSASIGYFITHEALVITGFGNNSLIPTEAIAITLTLPTNTIEATTYQYSGLIEDCDSTAFCGGIVYSHTNLSPPYEEADYSSNHSLGSFTLTFLSLDYQSGGQAIGTFSATLVKDNSDETIQITDGAFNVPID